MDEYQSKLNPGQIQFHEWCPPPLEPGDYTAHIDHSVTELEAFDRDFTFSVAGPRFSLNPSEVYSVYPPKGQIGDFANSLPHVVFTRRTLPWERSVYPGPRQPSDKLPWMALLVFSAADFPENEFPKIELLSVGNLINPKPSDAFVGPKLARSGKSGLAAYEKEADLCNTLELSWELFQSIAPANEDLAYLAHVREVDTGNKETLSFLADGWFSVVLANRLPEPEQPLSAASIDDVANFVTKLRTRADPVSKVLWQQFSPTAQDVLKVDTSAPLQQQRSVLVDALNRIVRGKSIYDDAVFAKVILSAETIALRDKLKGTVPKGSDARQFNKLLLEDAYPDVMVRRPPTAFENRAYLVSLEGLTDYLPGSGSTVNKPVRMALLSSWSFHCREAFAFKASMAKLNVDLLAVPDLGDSAKTVAEKQVNDAWQVGYTALNHSTRLGEKAVSWYRGPLVPLYLSKQTNYIFRPAADAALRYSPLDGMMDVSYAAAYQLGRLLALQDRHFATALFSYRSGVQRQINYVLGRKRVASIFAGATGDQENEIMSDYLKKLGSLTAPGGWTATDSVFPTGSNAGDPKQQQADLAKLDELGLTTDFDLTIPQAVCRWLARLVLLYRVPFTNLVADERMLPPDSVRFFYLDPNWIKCLLEGACSVGRSSSRDELVDEYLRGKFLDFAMEQALEVRTRTPAASASDSIAVQKSPAQLPNWPLTGFLLRSPAVEGWQGLEMRAWKDRGKDATQLLDPLRIDRLAPDIMLCIYNGQVNRIEIKQPPEGMHFGASVDGDGFKRFHLRRLNDKSDNDYPDGVSSGPGHQLIDASKTDIPLRVQNLKRVVRVSALAQALKTKLEELNARVEDTEFTSADFGVEMVESPGRVVFDVDYKKAGTS